MESRLFLSPVTAEDVEFLADIKMDADLWAYEDFIPTDREAVINEIFEHLDGRWYKDYLIRLNDPEKTPVGELHLHWYVGERKSWELGYGLFPAYRGQGYCLEAAQIAMKWAFEEFQAHKVIAMCNACNHRSSHVMDKLGMKLEGRFREELPWQGKWVDQLFFCILEDEYRELTKRS